MIRALVRSYFVVLAAGVLALTGACTMKSQEPPPLAGPSEFDLSIALTASPDQLQQDGASQSLIAIIARDANSQPVRNLSIRAQMAVGGTLMDFGSLSARSLVTGNDGRAQVVYTAPPAPAVAPDNFTIVDIVVTPLGTNYDNTNSRAISIRLYPSGVIVPNPNLQPAFTISPTAPEANQSVLFDASTSTGSIVSYDWRFGDGGRGSGRTTTHRYDTAGTYIVTLTVSDQYGRTEQASQSVNVGAGVNPSASFSTSPTAPVPLQDVFFNAANSRAAPGRTIVTYQWDFGDGSGGSGVQPRHQYAVAGTYRVTLTVTDDAARTGVASETVTVGNDLPTASFTVTPQSPTRGVPAALNASASSAIAGRTITSYAWSFVAPQGVTPPAPTTGVAVSVTFPAAGTYSVTLTVTDSASKSNSTTQTVIVIP